MQAMSEREKSYVLWGKVQLDDACLGGEHNGGKPGRGSVNKVPIVAAVSFDEACHPIHVKVAKFETFSLRAVADWAQDALARGFDVNLDGLDCFLAVAEVRCIHQPVVDNGHYPKDLPDFRWINTMISNLKTSFSGTFHALNFEKYADSYLETSVIGSIAASTSKR